MIILYPGARSRESRIADCAKGSTVLFEYVIPLLNTNRVAGGAE